MYSQPRTGSYTVYLLREIVKSTLVSLLAMFLILVYSLRQKKTSTMKI